MVALAAATNLLLKNDKPIIELELRKMLTKIPVLYQGREIICSSKPNKNIH